MQNKPERSTQRQAAAHREIDSPGIEIQIASVGLATGDEPKVALMYVYRAILVFRRLSTIPQIP
jgi:hypothetical protein